jgi:general secretion pathway protein K
MNLMRKQSGMALIVAMLILAITTMIATQIFYQQQIQLRRTLNQIQAEQLYQLLISIENWEKVILIDDLTKNQYDYSGDNWAQTLPVFDAENAIVKAQVIDAQGCFNLNNLVLNGKAQPEQIEILQNLMRQLKLNPELVWTLVDWLDSDEEPYPNGAEWETYSRFTPSYRAANFRLIEIEELYMVANWTAETIKTLTPHICVLPPTPNINQFGRFYKENQITPINVNTASELVLRSLSTQMLTANLTTILQYRKYKPYESIDKFISQLDTDNPAAKNQALSQSFKRNFIQVDSHYFKLDYTAWLGQLEQHYQSLFYRSADRQVYTLYRSQQY